MANAVGGGRDTGDTGSNDSDLGPPELLARIRGCRRQELVQEPLNDPVYEKKGVEERVKDTRTGCHCTAVS